ncbi:MAG: aldo/keto reductase [Mogibacterium sp.]|nr:aldo/keto reductase [Mogibacterium sp.]
MRQLTLGTTGITVPQNAFGALPIQRRTVDDAVRILRRAYEGGMTYFDTARAYSDSETKLGIAFEGIRDKLFIATKTAGKTGDAVRADLETSLRELRTDYIDLYQLHMVGQCYKPGDGTGVYEALVEAKEAGKIRHFGVTAHKIGVAFECVESGLYETMQFPFSYLSDERDFELARLCAEKNMGFIAMKSLAGGLISRSDVAMAFLEDFPNVLPIWGIQKDSELEEFLSYMENTPVLTDEMREYIEAEKKELSGDFCRGCGYCMPTCPMGITINQCARMSLMLRRAPSDAWLNDHWQAEMKKIETCINCHQCTAHGPYELDTPELLRKNYEDYKRVLAGEVSVK